MLDLEIVENEITGTIIGCAIEVHRELGPGLLESVYESAIEIELLKQGLLVERQIRLPVVYKGEQLKQNFIIDLLVERCVVVELKSIDKVTNIHLKQLLTYLKLSGKHVGLLLNFNVAHMKDGIFRTVHQL
jgi:GxxExxY protein